MKIEMRKLATVRPYERNPRDNDAAVEAVAESIRQFGFRQPVVVDADGVIVVGHVRYRAAERLGLEEIPVHVAADLRPELARAYRIADNRTGELAKWNYELLPLELADLAAAGVDLDLTGFLPEQVAELLDPGVADGLTDPDAVPEPPDEPITRSGDLWRLGQHRLYCGDSASRVDVDRLLDGAVIQLVNMDPPYNVRVEPRSNNAIAAAGKLATNQSRDVARHPEKNRRTDEKLRPKDRPLKNDYVSDAEFERLLRAWFAQAARVLDGGGSFYIWGGYANVANYPPALAESGFRFSQAIIWVKEHPVLSRKDFMGNHEWCFYGWKKGAAHRFFGPHNVPDTWQLTRADRGAAAIGTGIRLEAADGSRIDVLPPREDARIRMLKVSDDGVVLCGATEATDVWRVKKVTPTKMVHLTEKPVELAVRAIRYSSLPGENVLDLFGGSGSTLIGCEQTGRRAFLMELDPLYCDVIVRRWEEFTGRKAERQ